MSESGSQQPRPAYCEEYSEEAQQTVPETKQSANIAAKRSKPEITRSGAVRDEFSDSGYSSHTHPSLNNSSLDSRVESSQANAEKPPVGNHQLAIRGNKQSEAGPQSGKGHAKRSQSKSRKDVSAQRKECWCDKCVAAAHMSTTPIEAHPSSNYAFAQPRQKTPAPPSPQSRRMPPAEGMPLREHVRPRAATYSRPRPMTFHAGAMQEPMIMAQPQYIVERQPPRQTLYPFPPPSYPPPQPTFFPPLPPPPQPQEFFAPMPLAYELPPQLQPPPRPRPHHWTSDHAPSRPQSMFYGNPSTFEFAEPIYGQVEPEAQPLERRLSRRHRRTSLREPRAMPEDDYQGMPAPPPPPPRIDTRSRQEHRPPMRHAVTSSAAQHELRHRGSAYDSAEAQVSARNSRKPSFEDAARSRRPSLARPKKISDEKAVSFDTLEYGLDRMTLDPASVKQRQRSSAHGHESLKDLEGSVEAYQQSKGTLRSPIFTSLTNEDPMRLSRKKTNTTDNSDTGSRVSAHSRGSRGSREGSDVKSRKSSDRRPSNEVSTKSEQGDRWALRFNPEGTNVKMQGNMEGRSINLRKSKDGDGDMELSIESRGSGGGESNRGRTVGSRPTLTRDKSRRRYSYIEGQGVRELEAASYEASARPTSIARGQSREEEGPRVVAERIVTTTRSRRSSRYAYDGRERMF